MAAMDELAVNDSDIYYEFLCTICAEKGGNIEALKHCNECAENLCDSCLDNHNMFKAMRGHTLVEVGNVGQVSVNPDEGPVLPAPPNVECKSHVGNRIELYCGNHDTVGCSTCTSLHHKLCEDMHYILEAAVGFKHKDEPNGVTKSIDGVVQRTQVIKKKEEQNLERILSTKDADIKNITDRMQTIKKRLDHLKDKAIEEVTIKYVEIEQTVTENISQSNDLISKLEHEKRHITSAQRDNEAEMFINVKQGQANKNECERRVLDLEKSVIDVPITVSVNDTVLKTVTELESFVSFTLPADDIPGKTDRNDNQGNKLQKRSVNTGEDLQFSLERKQNVRVRGDKKVCDITDCCVLDNGNILLTDEKNECLKLFDSFFRLLDRRKIDDAPTAVCLVDKYEVAVALYDEESIQFAIAQKKINLTRSVDVGESCRGVAYANSKLYVSCGGRTSDGEGPGQVKVFDRYGKLLQTVNPHQPTEYTFSVPNNIITTSNGGFIVTNNRKGILAFDKQGDVLWRYQHGNLLNAMGLCKIDDMLLISCCNSGTVFNVSQDGQWSRILLNGLGETTSVNYKKDNSSLIITKGDCDHVLVYKRK